MEAAEVTKSFRAGSAWSSRSLVAVERVSLAVDPDRPEILSVVGESGSGKTTLARLLLGLEAPTAGRVLYRGAPLTGLAARDRRRFRRDVQCVFQDPYSMFNPFYRVDHVFDMTLRHFPEAAGGDRTRAVREALRVVELDPDAILGRFPHELSGGQRQRVMLARTYMLHPRLIVADEPVSMLDAAVRASFLNVLVDFRERYGISTLFITHDLATVHYVGGQMIVMLYGRVVERGPVDAVLHEPAHPYTRELIASIPDPDPDLRWSAREPAAGGGAFAEEAGAAPRTGCVYALRCPHAGDRCRVVPPSFRAVADGQEAACVLYPEEVAAARA